MLLPFLLRKHKTWKNTSVRLFTIAQPEDNTVQMKIDLEKFLYHLRIEAIVFVIEMDSSDISEYTYERTLKIEERIKILKEMNPKEKKSDIQAQMDEVVLERKYSKSENRRATIPSIVFIENEKENNNDIELITPVITTTDDSNSKVRFSENSVEVCF